MSQQTIASPRTSVWWGPIEITWCGSVAMPSIPIRWKCMDGWFVSKSIAHGSKCPIELSLRTDVGRKFSWLMKTCSEFPLHLRDAANKVIQIVHVHMQTSGLRFVKTVNINFIDNIPTFPFTKSLWSYSKLLLICLLEFGFGFDQSLSRGKPVGKSPYCRSFDRSANWRVKDSMNAKISTPGCLASHALKWSINCGSWQAWGIQPHHEINLHRSDIQTNMRFTSDVASHLELLLYG